MVRSALCGIVPSNSWRTHRVLRVGIETTASTQPFHAWLRQRFPAQPAYRVPSASIRQTIALLTPSVAVSVLAVGRRCAGRRFEFGQ
jgi:hypothetical protein